MNSTTINTFFRSVGRGIARNSPTILTGLGVAGFITTVIMAVRATPKALDDLEKHVLDKDKHISLESKLTLFTPLEIVKLTWKNYIPSFVVGSTTIGCIIFSNSINNRRNAALASLYSIASATMDRYQKEVIEQLGVNKEEKIRGEVSAKQLADDPIESKTIIITNKGDTLCYDVFSGRYFKSDIETIRRIQNDFNRRLLIENELNLNELYYELGLETIDMGRMVGWSSDRDMLEILFSAKIATDGQPCVVINFKNQPVKLWR